MWRVVPKANKTEVSKSRVFDFLCLFGRVFVHSPITASSHEGRINKAAT